MSYTPDNNTDPIDIQIKDDNLSDPPSGSRKGVIITLSIIACLLLTVLGILLFVVNGGTFGIFAKDPNEAMYDSALELMENGQYQEAAEKLELLSDYKDAQAMLGKCQEQIADYDMQKQYNSAKALLDSGRYDKAIEAFKKIESYKDAKDQISACQDGKLARSYTEATKYLDKKRYKEAYNIFALLGDYKDAKAKSEELALRCALMDAKVGEYITFGKYEQDNNTANGKEDIEWIVLERRGTRLLVTSRYALDCQKYHNTMEEVTWATCSLREWLNSTFIRSAFSTKEKAMIPSVSVSVQKHPNATEQSPSSVRDQVFLLSISEAQRYFKTDESRACTPTAYASARGSCHSSVTLNAWCWLRSNGHYIDYATGVTFDGSIYNPGNPVNYTDDSVRPAMWIDYTA